MAVLAGIDEAGFGPILGPLVVSSTAFSLPDELLGANLWRILQGSVSDKRKGLAGRVLICDSKKAYTRAAGIGHLERTTLACLGCIGRQAATLAELTAVVSVEAGEPLTNYPWYKEVDNYRLGGDKGDLAIAQRLLTDNFAANHIRMLDLRSCCLDAGRYNTMVGAARNKANVLFSAVCRLIGWCFDNFGHDNLQIIVDRQGGRSRYGRNLLLMFPGADLTILQEDEQTSSYQLRHGGRGMRIHFTVRADSRFLPVSLASMVSKYIRELFVDNINRYFRGFSDQIRPTAGYWKDGLRFIADIKKQIPHVRFDPAQLIRCR